MYLIRDNTRIYYEVCGEGEALILIHGVITDSGLYSAASRILSEHYRVITYDRRNNSRSRPEQQDRGPEGSDATPDFNIDEQAADILALMDELDIEKAYIAGVSGGAVIGLHFLRKYPERVRHLVMYEAAMLGYMRRTDPEYKEWAEKTESLVRAGKLNSALLRFASHIGPADERGPARSEDVLIREMGNLEYAMKTEIPGLQQYDPDPEEIRRHAGMITVAAGEKSGDNAYVRGSRRLAQILGTGVLYYPGGHNMPHDLPREFAVCILGTLELHAFLHNRIGHSG